MKKYELNEIEIEDLKFYQRLNYNYIVSINNELLLSENKPSWEPLPYGGMKWIGKGKWQYVLKTEGLFESLEQDECIAISDLLAN